MIQFTAQTLPDGIRVISAVGQLDENTSRDFFDCLEEAIEQGQRRIVVQCAGLDYFSSVGVSVLIRVHSRMKKLGGDVKLAALQGGPAELLRITHLDRVLGVYPDVAAAQAAFGPPPDPA